MIKKGLDLKIRLISSICLLNFSFFKRNWQKSSLHNSLGAYAPFRSAQQLSFCFANFYELLSIKGEQNFKLSWFAKLCIKNFERENSSGAKTPQICVLVNQLNFKPKMEKNKFDRNFIFSTFSTIDKNKYFTNMVLKMIIQSLKHIQEVLNIVLSRN